jgi:hypothetical protein
VNGVKHGHYHFILLMDGNKTQSHFKHMQRAEEIWNQFFGWDTEETGLLHCRPHAENNSIMLRPDAPDLEWRWNECLTQSLYLAKSATKHRFGEQGRIYGCSQGIPPRAPVVLVQSWSSPSAEAFKARLTSRS